MLSGLLSLVAPPLCFACGAHAGEGRPLCADCRRGQRWLGGSGHASPGPGLPVGTPAGLPVWAPLAYEGPAAALVRALKFRGALPLADVMAAQMAANAPPWVFGGSASEAPRLVPVPLHPARRGRRGFNQAERLASALGLRTGLEVDDCLERVGHRRTQMGRGRAERATAMRATVEATRRPPPLAVLVDDVATTGATLAACAVALRAAGAVEVRGVAYARTPGR